MSNRESRITASTNEVTPTGVDELLANPSLAGTLPLETIAPLMAQIASRVASLHTLERSLLALVLSQRIATAEASGRLMSAAEVAELFDVPETWVREQARFGKLPSVRLGHYVRFRVEDAERFLAERTNKAA